MSQWNWKPERTQGVWRTGPAWLRPFLSAVPWITVLLLVLMFHIVGGTLVSSEGVLFDLPDSTGLRDDEPAPLVALVMPMSRETLPQQETLVFFDDGRYSPRSSRTLRSARPRPSARPCSFLPTSASRPAS